jgi:signal transduction histidine kinase
VQFDSAGLLAPGSAADWRLDPLQIERIERTTFGARLRDRLAFYAGDFEGLDGRRWAFVGLGLNEPGPDGLAMLFAEPQPNLSLRDSLAAFGSELLPPLLQAGLVGMIAAVVMAIFISRGIARPLQRIARAAGAVADGQYDTRVPVTGPAEVRAVATAFNDMSGQVKTSQNTQRDFLVNVSHDLKTPLTSIQGYSQAIIDGATPDPVDAAQIIYDEATRLNRLVVQLTDLARLQSGQLEMQMVELDLSQIVGAVGQKLTIVAERQRLTLLVDVPPLPAVCGDGDRLAQVVTNLLSNAIKYTPAGGQIRARTSINNGGIEFTVQDTGIGLPADELSRVFERFYQVDKARGPQRGTGLGLAITREIVQAHGGTITVTSAGRGHGSTFTVWLPSPHLRTAQSGNRLTRS